MQGMVVGSLQDTTLNDSLFSKGAELLAAQMTKALDKLEQLDINGIAAMMARGFLARLDRSNNKTMQSNIKNTVGIDLQGQIKAEGLDPLLNMKIAENTALIKSIKDEYKENVGKLLRDNVMNGERPSNIVTQIKEIGGVTKSRAKFIARDQTAKTNADITQLRAESLGSKTYIWSGSMDEREREDHKAMEGKLCKWDDPTVYSDDNGETWKSRRSIGGVMLHVGKDYSCRCVALPVVSWS